MIGSVPSIMAQPPASTPSDADTDPRQQLRAATAALHAQVDGGMPLSRPDVRLPDYQQHLALLRTWVDALGPRVPALTERLGREAAALQADLDECRALLGSAAPAPDAPDSPPWASTAPLHPDAEGFGWGVAYVIEGSRLGGQVLHRRLAQALAPHSLAYLRGAGHATGAHWSAFLTQLRAALETPQRVQAACEGATLAFTLLLQCAAMPAPECER